MSDDVAGGGWSMPPVLAPPLPGRVIFDQRWVDLVFLHWPVDPDAVARFMPRRTRPDVWRDGLTYVGLVPFRMRGAGLGTGPPVPYVGSFLEWNVRLYSVDAEGRHGVVFRSLDATRLPIVAVANAGRVPYRWAQISTRRDGDHVEWRMRRRRLPRRRGEPAPTSRLQVLIGPVTEPTDLELFLVSRWGMHSSFARRTVWVPNAHGQWPLWSPGVHARFSMPRIV